MSFMRRIFGGGSKPPPDSVPAASMQFHESMDGSAQGSRSAPRRELVKVVLRDTLRRHGVPSDWIDSRILSVMSAAAVSGLHVHFVVRHGHEQLLSYVPAFQASFLRTLEGFDPRSADWLFSVSWEFANITEGHWPSMPDPSSWTQATPVVAAPVAPVEQAGQADPPAAVEIDLVSDTSPAPDAVPDTPAEDDLQPTVPSDLEPEPGDDDVHQDLKALFAIRDAAMLHGPDGPPDFAPTEPGGLPERANRP
jgi:hypothetical protein